MPAHSKTSLSVASTRSQGWAWVFGGLTLTLGTAAPALYMASHWQEILAFKSMHRVFYLQGTDLVFFLAATMFFFYGHVFGVQRNGPTLPFPGTKVKLDSRGRKPAFYTAGPMVELDGTRRAPAFFIEYVSLVIVFSLLVPAAGLAYLIWQGQAEVGINTLGTHLLNLLLQIASEYVTLELGTPMWVQVPQTYQPYRLWQLARGLFLGSAMAGPAWLQTLQEILVVLWVFNYGAQMTFTPWLYRWHLQPSSDKQQ